MWRRRNFAGAFILNSLTITTQWWENPKAKYQRVTLCQVSELSQFVRMDGHLMELGFKVGERVFFFGLRLYELEIVV